MKMELNNYREVDFDYLDSYNEFFISYTFDLKKFSISNRELEGIILK